jgi:hypothetical protein
VAINAPHFIILLCLTPDDVTHQGESGATQWVNIVINIVNIVINSLKNIKILN